MINTLHTEVAKTAPVKHTEAEAIAQGICPDCGGESHTRCTPQTDADDEIDTTPEQFDAIFAEAGPVDPPTRNTDAENAAIARYCGCDCAGCASTSTHCLKLPCRRQKNRRTRAELDAAGRYPNGRIREAHVAQQVRKSPKPRTPEEIEAAGRYPNGRARPNRSNWTDAPRSRRAVSSTPAAETPLPKPAAGAKPDPLAIVPIWFVRARRGITVTLPAPAGRDEAYAMAGYLFMFGWDVKVVKR